MFSQRPEIGMRFFILEEILRSENIWDTGKRNYNAAIGLKSIPYNLMVISNTKEGDRREKIKKILSC